MRGEDEDGGMGERTAAGDASATDAATTAMIAESFMMSRAQPADAKRRIERITPKVMEESRKPGI